MIAQRDSVEAAAWRIQATWLAESALERAAAQLAADAAYRGETWTIPAKELDAHNAAVVRIEVQTVSESPKARRVRVQADFPNHPEHRARQTKETVVYVP
jgi:Tfp pilus assembly protein PilV